VFSPRQGDLRFLGIDDDDARRCTRWLALYATVTPLNYTLLWLVERIGFPQAVLFGSALVLGVVMTAYKIAMLWALRRPIERAILAATESEPSPFRRAVAAGWHWFFIGLALVILVEATIAFALGKGASVYAAATLTQLILVVLAIAWQGAQKLIDQFAARAAAATEPGLRQRRFLHAARRICDTLLALLGIVWLGRVWGLDLVAPPAGSLEQLLLRPALSATLTVVAAWILWVVVSAIIDEQMPQPGAPGDDEGQTAERVSRLGTLLPLLRNLVLVGIGIVALAVALSSLGVNLAPLFAGLGVIGIALGFGAQNLVRDIISGVFFLMEDAFRVGDYIDTGRLRGTVEGMSLRSVRLRHQNGPVHTIPFGQVQAVTNYSRDWAIVKFNLHLDPANEIELVRKTIKRAGEELLEDPEIGAEFISPLKMQGVTDVSQTALVVRCKFTALPGRPTYLQRQALHRLIAAFGGAEIRFAAPNLTLQLSGA
jgi:moderate conductance mechanosensitive channel